MRTRQASFYTKTVIECPASQNDNVFAIVSTA